MAWKSLHLWFGPLSFRYVMGKCEGRSFPSAIGLQKGLLGTMQITLVSGRLEWEVLLAWKYVGMGTGREKSTM